MTDSLEAAEARLVAARQRGDAAGIAEALAGHANALLERGQTDAARQELDEAAEIHSSRGSTFDQARCLQMAGTLCRFLRQFNEARDRQARALELVEGKGPIAVSSHAELGEIALAEGRAADAAAAYGSALDAAESADTQGSARASLLRKRAASLATAGRFTEAVEDLESACRLLLEAGDQGGATRALIEQATARQHARQFEDAESAILRATQMAEAAGDHAALADLHVLRTTQSLQRHDTNGAMASAQAARREALAANAPVPYIAAAHAISQVGEATGDRLTAYEALAIGWVTLADLLPENLARAAFEPKLREMRDRWGAQAFDEIKNTYEASRRKAKADTTRDA